MNYGITGFSSTISQRFINMKDSTGTPIFAQNVGYSRDLDRMPMDFDRYLLCAGVLHGKSMQDMEEEEMWETMRVNFLETTAFCERLFESNMRARVCVIGSMSGLLGSYDIAYAGAKAAMHMYVETKRLKNRFQHLVAIAPTIIMDSGMTARRADIEHLKKRGEQRRLGRWLNAEEVASAALFALENDAVCNTVIKLNGGNW